MWNVFCVFYISSCRQFWIVFFNERTIANGTVQGECKTQNLLPVVKKEPKTKSLFGLNDKLLSAVIIIY